MADAPLVIVSPHEDFAQTLAEQVKAELGLACTVLPDFADMPVCSLVVTTEAAPAVSCPVVGVERGPLRMVSVLASITQVRQQQAEDVALPAGLVLKVRAKILQYQTSSVDLTDKEVAIIQSLQGAGAEGLSREALLKKVWGFDSSLDTHTLETHIYRLRNKIRELCGDEALLSATPGGYAMGAK